MTLEEFLNKEKVTYNSIKSFTGLNKYAISNMVKSRKLLKPFTHEQVLKIKEDLELRKRIAKGQWVNI